MEAVEVAKEANLVDVDEEPLDVFAEVELMEATIAVGKNFTS